MNIKTEESRVVVKKLLEVMTSGDEIALNNLFAEDATMIINLLLEKPYGGTFVGRKSIVEGFIQRSMQLVKEGTSLKLINIIAEGSKVAIEWASPDKTSAIQNCSVLMEIENCCIQYISVFVNT